MIPTAVLICDARDCSRDYQALGNVMQVRRAAGRDGWWYGVRRRTDAGPALTFDFCPEHHDKAEVVGAVRVTP